MKAAILKFTGLSKLGGLLAAAGMAIAALGIFGVKMKRTGRKKERAKQTEKINAKVKTAKQVRRAVRIDPSKHNSVRRFDRD